MSGHLISPDLLEIMQCPACAGELLEFPEPPALVCQTCGLRYPVRDGIPVMLIEEASPSAPSAPAEDPSERNGP